MALSYIGALRRKIGNDLLLLPSVAALIRDEQGRLLLQRKGGDEGWSLPAGGIEPGESPIDALCREVCEETGFTVADHRLVAAFGGAEFRYKYPNGDRVEYTVLVFECSVRDTGTSFSDEETVELAYFDRENFPGLALPYPLEMLFPSN